MAKRLAQGAIPAHSWKHKGKREREKARQSERKGGRLRLLTKWKDVSSDVVSDKTAAN